MRKLLIYLKDFKKQLILGPIFKLTEAIFELIVPLIMAQIIDIGIKNNDMGYILKMGGLLILLGVVGLACALTCQFFAAQASQGFGTILRNALFTHINSLSFSNLDSLSSSSLITRMTNDINQMQVGVAMLIRLVVRAPFIAIGATVMAMLIDFKLSLLVLAAVAIVSLLLYGIMSRSIPLYRRIQKKLDDISRVTKETLTGARVVRAFSNEKQTERDFAAIVDDSTRTSLRVGKLSALLNPLTSAVMNLAIVGVLWFGGVRVNIGELTQGELIAFVNYITQILLAVVVLANLIITLTKAYACSGRVAQIFDITSDLSFDGTAPLEEQQPEALCFDHVFFSYGKDEKYALKDISFSIKAGETIGIIGATGSGKSTLIHLIPRFYEATKGTVFFFGKPITDYARKTLTAHIAVVAQQSILFEGTIAQNIRVANPALTDQEIWNALTIAQALDFVKQKPKQLDFSIEQGGKNLSGGQRQRLSIARAVAANASILILDDSFSALDYATDLALRKSLKAMKQTVIVVSQRVSSISHADQILVLEEGNLVSKGTHEELLAGCEVYAQIAASQSKTSET